jgi:hypothetical protein
LFTGSVAENVARGRAMNINEPLIELNEAMQAAEEEYRRDHPDSWFSCCFSSSTASSSFSANPAAPPHKFTPVPSSAEEGKKDHSDIENKKGEIEMASSGNTLVDVDDDIIEACKLSNAHDFIVNFTNGYHTEIGEGYSFILSFFLSFFLSVFFFFRKYHGVRWSKTKNCNRSCFN